MDLTEVPPVCRCTQASAPEWERSRKGGAALNQQMENIFLCLQQKAEFLVLISAVTCLCELLDLSYYVI